MFELIMKHFACQMIALLTVDDSHCFLCQVKSLSLFDRFLKKIGLRTLHYSQVCCFDCVGFES